MSLFFIHIRPNMNILRWLRELNALQIEKNSSKLRKQLPQLDNTHMLTTRPNKETHCKYNYLFVCVVSICSTCCRCFLNLLVLFLFACVFWSCSALSSLGHHNIMSFSHFNYAVSNTYCTGGGGNFVPYQPIQDAC